MLAPAEMLSNTSTYVPFGLNLIGYTPATCGKVVDVIVGGTLNVGDGAGVSVSIGGNVTVCVKAIAVGIEGSGVRTST